MVLATDTQNFIEKNTEFIAFRNELHPVGSVAMNMYINMLNGCCRVRLSRTQVITNPLGYGACRKGKHAQSFAGVAV